ETGQPLEARALFETAAASMPTKPLGAEAALMAERAMAQDFRKRLDDAVAERSKASKEDQIVRAEARLKAAPHDLVEHAKHMERRADSTKTPLAPEIRSRLNYEAAWIYRMMAPFTPLNPQGRAIGDTDAKDPFLKEMLDYTRASYTR